MSYQSFSLKLLERFVEPYVETFKHLRFDLQAAGITLSIREYLSVALMSIIISFLGSLIFLSLIFGVVAPNPLLGFFTAFSGTIFLTVIIAAAFYMYPSAVASNRKKKINISLPFATTYMATISGSGASPVAIFKLMAEFEQYGEFSQEIRKIVRDIQVFGYDLQTAIKKVSIKSPSDQFRDLMYGVLASLSSGSNLTQYLQAKSKTYLSDYRRKLEEYSKQLSLYVEIYLTLIIVGSIFFMVLSTVMSAISLSGGLITLQFFIVFILMPLISLGFIYMLKATNPTEA